jgi:hypothetical protein
VTYNFVRIPYVAPVGNAVIFRFGPDRRMSLM